MLTVHILVLLALVASSPGVVSGQSVSPRWTSVGSAGTVDEADVGEVHLSRAEVFVSQAPASVVVRYNVVGVQGVVGGNSLFMTVRYRDAGPEARVQVKLRGTNINTGVITTIAMLDSDTFPQSISSQRQTVVVLCGTLDFENNAYYMEATLTKSTTGFSPALTNLRLCALSACEG